MSRFADLPLLDAHVHLGSHRAIAPLVELTAEAGADRLAIVCVPGTPERSLGANAAAFLAKSLYPDRVYVFGGLHYRAGRETTPGELLRQAEELQAAGCDSLKMLEGKPSTRKRIPYSLDDPIYDPLYSFFEETGLPIVSHVADPETFWDPARVSPMARQHGWDYTDGTFPGREQLYAEVDGLLAKHPRLRLVLCHFYFLSNEPDRAEAFLKRWPNVSFDLTPGAEMYRNFSKDPARWRAFFLAHQDRLVFGTDNVAPREPWAETRPGMLDKVRMMRQFLETAGPFEGFGTATSREVIGLGLPASALPGIYSGNFERFVGVRPRPLVREAAARLIHSTLAFARATAGQADLAGELAEIERLLAG